MSALIEHHANLLPWARLCDRRFVECGIEGTFTCDDSTEVLDASPRPKLLAISGTSNVTGWRPPLEEIIEAAHQRGIPVLVDSASPEDGPTGSPTEDLRPYSATTSGRTVEVPPQGMVSLRDLLRPLVLQAMTPPALDDVGAPGS